MPFAKLLTRYASFGPGDELEENGESNTNSTKLTTSTSTNNVNDLMMASKKNPPNNNKAVSGRRRFGENGFEEGGGYMAVKRAKLDNQFNVAGRAGLLRKNDESMDTAEIFKGIAIHINGYTEPPEPELREIFILHGGTYHTYNNSRTTYVVATNLSAPTKRICGAKTITPNWVMDSIAAGKPLDTRKYMLYNFNKERNQMTLTQIMQSKTSKNQPPPPSINGMFVPSQNGNTNTATRVGQAVAVNRTTAAAPVATEPYRIEDDDDDRDKVSASEDEDEFFECSQDTPDRKVQHSTPFKSAKSTPTSKAVQDSESDSDIFEKSQTEDSPEKEQVEVIEIPSSNESAPVQECTSPQKINSVESSNLNQKSPTSNKPGIKTATEDGFLEDFFGRSRLHLISEQKKEMQMFIANLKKNIDSHSFSNLQKFESEFANGDGSQGMQVSSNEVVLLHVDMDCFFVSVGLLSRPHLRGKPVIVTHSSGKGQESRSDIACASYEARKFGVRNGMWVGEAKAMCPELEVIPYDFEEYKRVSKLFYEAVASVTLDVEASSVDEMIIDATATLKKVPGASPEDLAAFLRKLIKENTNCPASIGIGSNRLLAKLAVKLAKPDGIHCLKDEDAPDYISNLQVRDLPGVGWSNEGKLRELNVITCGDLLNVPFKDLRMAFGEKTAEKLLNLCKGKDTSEIKTGIDRPKSLSVDVNFGIRFTRDDEVCQFLMKICKELSSRAEKAQAVSTHFTLKLLIRKKGAGEPMKQGGHGIVDSMTRSRTLMNPTRNWNEFYKTALSLSRLMRVPPSEYRGVGVTLSELVFDYDKSSKKSVQRTLTDMPISRAQKMLSIINQKKRTSITETDSSQSSQSSNENGTEEQLEQPPTVMPANQSNSTTATKSLSNGKYSLFGMGRKNESSTNTNGQVSSTSDLSKLPVDINVLRQLPREIAEEQCQIYGINKELLDGDNNAPSESSAMGPQNENQGNTVKVDNYYDNVETIDQSFLLALPDNVRQDVLIQLQEAKGRRNITTNNVVVDDQQPCSSRQAIERSKQMELAKSLEKNVIGCDKSVGSSEKAESLAGRTTPIIPFEEDDDLYTEFDPKRFWNMEEGSSPMPFTTWNRPALNGLVRLGEVRDLIREGLTVVKDPMREDVECLENYFTEMIKEGWLEQTEALIKFVYRQAIQLGSNSLWTPHLHSIIALAQERCRDLYHGEFEVE